MAKLTKTETTFTCDKCGYNKEEAYPSDLWDWYHLSLKQFYNQITDNYHICNTCAQKLFYEVRSNGRD